jgi:hypothetical protein
MTDEPKVFALLRQYDERKRELSALEAELNRECALYGQNVLHQWAFSHHHLRQRLYALGLTKKEQDQ